MAWSSLRITILFLFVAVQGWAQQNRYMVFFSDKNGIPFSVDRPAEFLSQKAIERRVKHNVQISPLDLPVSSAYIQSVSSTGAEVYFATRWLNAVLVQCDEALLPTIEDLDFVDSVRLVAYGQRLSSGGRVRANQKVRSSKANVTDAQLQMIGLDRMHADNYDGTGITIAVLDAGFPGVNTAEPFQHLFDGRIDENVSKDFISNSETVFQYDEHGTNVLSVIGASQDGVFTGGAPGATFQLYVTEDAGTEYRIEEYNWLFAAERADSAGADIIHSSLGYYDFDDASMNYSKAQMDGKTAIITKAAQMAYERGMVVVVSAGNEGNNSWKIITAPADAAGALAVASVNDEQVRSNSSSIGPSADNRIKPDIAAMGVSTSVILSNGNTGKSSGTSLAAPLITSLAAGLWQRYPSMTNTQIMEAIRMSGTTARNPDNLLGYGVANYTSAVAYLDKVLNERIFDVYPNPSLVDSVRIVSALVKEKRDCYVEFISADGRSAYKTKIGFNVGEREKVINTSRLSAGLYILRLTWNDKHYTFRFVKG